MIWFLLCPLRGKDCCRRYIYLIRLDKIIFLTIILFEDYCSVKEKFINKNYLELILASSEIPPLPGFEIGLIGSTLHSISSLQKFSSFLGPDGAELML